MFVFAVNMSVCVVRLPPTPALAAPQPLFLLYKVAAPPPPPSLPTHPHDPTNSVPHMIEGAEDRLSGRGRISGQLCHGDRCCNCQLMDHLSGSSLGFGQPGPAEGVEGFTGKDSAGSDSNGRATGSHLSAPLTVVMEIDNVIGHALRETPRRIKRGRSPPPPSS